MRLLWHIIRFLLKINKQFIKKYQGIMKQLIKKIKINTTIEVLTGLHIGGSKENVEIGGIDTPVIKLATKDNQPYIPGSSLKGKMRCLLEQVAGANNVGDNNEINNLFGFSNNQPSKNIVRDAMLTEKSVMELKNADNLDMPFTEGKWENVIDRVEGIADPRQIERVPAGAVFDAEFVINIWDDDKEKEEVIMQMFKKGIALIENDYLGGCGSRGSGQVKFGELHIQTLSNDNKWGLEPINK